MTERWVQIARFPDYEISSRGRVRRVRADSKGRHDGLVIKPQLGQHGYLLIKLLDGNGKRWAGMLSRLVCEAFHGPPPTPHHQAAHRSGDRLDNGEDNLRWATRRENARDKHEHGTTTRGVAFPQAKLDPDSVRRVRRLREAGRSWSEISREVGIGRTTAQDVISGKKWSHIQ